VLIDLAAIAIGDRLRFESYKEEDLAELAQSIEWMGQLQPIVIEENGGGYKLVAGYNRLQAVARLHSEHRVIPGVASGQIKAEVSGALSPETSLIIEFEENIRRKDLSHLEKARYIRKFHDLFSSKSSKWTAEMTAATLKLSKASISYYLNIEAAVQSNPEVAKATTLRSAVKRMKTVEQLERKRREVAFKATLGDVGVQRARDSLVLADAVDWIVSVTSGSVDLVNFDPPWGEDVSRKSAENWDSFDDTSETSYALLNALLPQLYRVLKPDSYCIFWYRQWAYAEMLERVQLAGFDVKFTRTPCIWYKPDKVSDQMRFPEKQLIDAYETFLLLRKGDPVFNEREIQNVFVEPRVARSQLIHPTEKPLALMERLIKLCCVPGAVVLDPCAGSAAALHAAWNIHRKPLGCELNEKFYSAAMARLSEAMK